MRALFQSKRPTAASACGLTGYGRYSVYAGANAGGANRLAQFMGSSSSILLAG
jgi:hypothetical protein